jgi:polar amino acid transport system permease protein
LQLATALDWNDDNMSSLYWPALAYATLHTLEFTGLGLAGSLVLGMILALMKVGKWRATRWIAIAYTELLKNTPLLVVMFVVYFGLPSAGIVLSRLIAGSLALTVCYAAYLSEIFRAGLQGVPDGQREAGYALGLSTFATYWNIILPQTFRLSLAATGNMVVDVLKTTSLISAIGGGELLTSAENITAATFQPMKVYLIVGGIYFALCFPLSRLVVWYESRLKAGMNRKHHRARLDAELREIGASA